MMRIDEKIEKYLVGKKKQDSKDIVIDALKGEKLKYTVKGNLITVKPNSKWSLVEIEEWMNSVDEIGVHGESPVENTKIKNGSVEIYTVKNW